MKRDILRFIKKIKRLFIVFEIIIFIVAAILLFYGLYVAGVYFIPFAICVGTFFLVFILYLSCIKYRMVYELTVSGETISLTVKGGTYTYSAKDAARVLYNDKKFIVFFLKGGVREKFVFLRIVPFDRFRTAQFTKEDIASFFPQIMQK